MDVVIFHITDTCLSSLIDQLIFYYIIKATACAVETSQDVDFQALVKKSLLAINEIAAIMLSIFDVRQFYYIIKSFLIQSHLSNLFLSKQ